MAGAKLAVGAIIAKRYKVEALLGEAKDYSLYECDYEGFTMIAKVYNDGLQPNEQLFNAIKELGSLTIGKIIDSGRDGNGVFCEIRFKYTNGNMAEEGAVNQKYLLKQFIPAIIEDLRNIHNAGLVHGKIRPYNLFHSEIGSDIILGDFGIDEVRNSLENEEFLTLAKDIGYLPPSAMKGIITKEDDYYALGMTLYQLATGIDLFKGLSDKELYKFAHMEYLNIRGNIDSTLANIIRGLTVKAKDERWGYTEVSRALQGEDVEINDDYVCDVDIDSFDASQMTSGDVVLKTKKNNIIISKVNTVEEDYDYHNFFDTDDNNDQTYFSSGFVSAKIDDDEAAIYEHGLYDEDDDDDGIEYANSYSNPSPIRREVPKEEENFISREEATDAYGIDDTLNNISSETSDVTREEKKEESEKTAGGGLSFDDLSFLDDIDDDDDFDIEELIKARLFEGKSAEETKELFTPKPKPKKEEPEITTEKPAETEKEEVFDDTMAESDDSEKENELSGDTEVFGNDKAEEDDLFGDAKVFAPDNKETKNTIEEDDDDLFGDSDVFGKMSESDAADDLFGDSSAFDMVAPKQTKQMENKSAFAAEVNKRSDSSFESKLVGIAKDIEPVNKVGEEKPVGIFKVSEQEQRETVKPIEEKKEPQSGISEHKPGIYKVSADEPAAVKEPQGGISEHIYKVDEDKAATVGEKNVPQSTPVQEASHIPGIYKVDSNGNLIVERYEPKKAAAAPVSAPINDRADEAVKNEEKQESGIKILSQSGQKPTFNEKADFKPKNAEENIEKEEEADIPIEESIEAALGIPVKENIGNSFDTAQGEAEDEESKSVSDFLNSIDYSEELTAQEEESTQDDRTDEEEDTGAYDEEEEESEIASENDRMINKYLGLDGDDVGDASDEEDDEDEIVAQADEDDYLYDDYDEEEEEKEETFAIGDYLDNEDIMTAAGDISADDTDYEKELAQAEWVAPQKEEVKVEKADIDYSEDLFAEESEEDDYDEENDEEIGSVAFFDDEDEDSGYDYESPDDIEPYEFEGKKYLEINQLIEEMAQNWDKGVEELYSGRLYTYFKKFKKEIAQSAKDCVEIEDTNLGFFKFIYNVNPNMPFYWKDIRFTNLNDIAYNISVSKNLRLYKEMLQKGLFTVYLNANEYGNQLINEIMELEDEVSEGNNNDVVIYKLMYSFSDRPCYIFEGYKFVSVENLVEYLYENKERLNDLCKLLMNSIKFFAWLEFLGFGGEVTHLLKEDE